MLCYEDQPVCNIPQMSQINEQYCLIVGTIKSFNHLKWNPKLPMNFFFHFAQIRSYQTQVQYPNQKLLKGIVFIANSYNGINAPLNHPKMELFYHIHLWFDAWKQTEIRLVFGFWFFLFFLKNTYEKILPSWENSPSIVYRKSTQQQPK